MQLPHVAFSHFPEMVEHTKMEVAPVDFVSKFGYVNSHKILVRMQHSYDVMENLIFWPISGALKYPSMFLMRLREHSWVKVKAGW